MTNEELFRAGDYDTLYTRNLPLIYHLAKRFSNLHIEHDDLVGCGNVAFAKSLHTFNADQSKWSTYFSKVMVNEILMLNRKAIKQTRCISFETVMISGPDNKTITMGECLGTREDVVEDLVERLTIEEVAKLINTLPDREREVIRLHLLGTRQADIGITLHLSQAYVSRMIKKVFNELRMQYQKGA